MKIWVVEHGEYSDRHVVVVTDNETTAQRVAEMGSSGTATEYELNVFADRLIQGYRCWRVTFLHETGDCLVVEPAYDPYQMTPEAPRIDSFPNPPSGWRPVMQCEVVALDEAEAVKIASDKRREFNARVTA